MNKENKKNIAIPPTLPTDSLWNACGFKNSLSKRESKKNIFEYFATKKVKNKINEGKSEKQIYEFLRERYGDWIIFEPELNKNTYILWLLPLLLFLLGGAIMIKNLIFKK